MGFPRQFYWSGLPFPSPGESFQLRDETHVSRRILYHWALRETWNHCKWSKQDRWTTGVNQIMWTEEDFLARVLPLQGLWGTAVGCLLATAAATLCQLFSKILGITVHVRGVWGGLLSPGKPAWRLTPKKSLRHQERVWASPCPHIRIPSSLLTSVTPASWPWYSNL